MTGYLVFFFWGSRTTLDHFLSCYEPLEMDQTRLHPSGSLGLWLLLEFGQWKTLPGDWSQWRKRLVDLILSSDFSSAGKWPSFFTEDQSPGQRPSPSAAAIYKFLPLSCGPKCVHHSLFLHVSDRVCYSFSVILYSSTTSNNCLSSLSSLYFPYLCKSSCFWTMIQVVTELLDKDGSSRTYR